MPDEALRKVRRAGLLVLALKLVAFCTWSLLLYRRFSLTPDFAQYQQAWYLIAHGHLDPYDTVSRFWFWQNHGEFIMWPLAILYWPLRTGVALLWVQDIGVIGAEVVAFLWACELAERYRPGRDARWLALAGLVLLVVNPWCWWATCFDFHTECVAVLFLALLARDLVSASRRAWLWVVPLVACGDVAGTYMAGLGLGVLIACRGRRRGGAVMCAAGVAAVLLVAAIHANKGSGHGFQAYAYLAAPGASYPGTMGLPGLLKGLASHPGAVLGTLWAKRLDIWANLAPSGLAGLAFIPLLPLVAVVIVTNDLFRGWMFSQPLFQAVPVYVLLPAATIGALGWLAGRRRRTGLVLTAVIVAQAIGWAAVWAPRTPSQWLRVPPATAATLAAVEARIPPSAAVFASQGVVGRFSSRLDIRPLRGKLDLVPGQNWFIFCPWDGAETQRIADAEGFAGELTSQFHAQLVTDQAGIWALRLTPPPGLRQIVVPDHQALPVPAWTAPGAAGKAVLTGPPATWHLTSTGQAGYVADRIEWLKPPGTYTASLRLRSAGPVSIEVWNNTGNVLLARDQLPSATATETVTLPVEARHDYEAPIFGGWGLFRARLGSGPAGERLEIRVWTPGQGAVNIYTAQLKTLSHS